MGGAGYIFTGEHDADVMHNSATINLNVIDACWKRKIRNVFYSSSACMYPAYNQEDPNNPNCAEDSAYPANPDSEYGWEKLFSERLYGAFARNTGLDVRIARLHNVYGPGNPWQGGREKAPAALCRKVAECPDGDTIDVWGDGAQTRSFLYIDDCIEGMRLLMRSPASGPVNIGSEQMISIGDLVRLIARIAGKTVALRHVRGPVGVRGRTSANRMMFEATGWQPRVNLEDGIARTFRWVAAQVGRERHAPAIGAGTAPV
jgi:GDP-D-mannose 3', 5'-epimerase